MWLRSRGTSARRPTRTAFRLARNRGDAGLARDSRLRLHLVFGAL